MPGALEPRSSWRYMTHPARSEGKAWCGAGVIVSMFHDRIDAEVLDAARARAAACATSPWADNIDLRRAASAGVVVCQLHPDAVTEGRQRTWRGARAVGRAPAGTGGRVRASRRVRSAAEANGDHRLAGRAPDRTEPADRGAGRIGKAVAATRASVRHARAVPHRLHWHVDFELALAAKRVGLDEGWRLADVVSDAHAAHGGDASSDRRGSG